MVVGSGRPHPTALICAELGAACGRTPVCPRDASPEELAQRDDVSAFLTREVHKQTRGLASYEQIRRVIVVPREFSVEGGELSPSMKIKRRVVEQRYAGEIEARVRHTRRRCRRPRRTVAHRVDEVVRGPIKSKTVFPALILHLIERQPDHGYGLMQRIDATLRRPRGRQHEQDLSAAAPA